MKLFSIFRRKKKRRAPTATMRASVLRSVEDQDNAAYFTEARDSSADEVCSAAERSRLRACCRKIQLDVSHAANAARSLALCVYGSGPSLQVKTIDNELNKRIESLFGRWRRVSGYDVTFFTAIQSLPMDGEAFFHTVYKPNVPGGLSVELLEPYRIEDPPGKSYDPHRFCGIQYDEFGLPESYSVMKVSENPLTRTIAEYEEVPAAAIEHLYIPLMSCQRRGLPLLQSALQSLAKLRKIEDSTLAAVETAANISFVLESDLDPTGESGGNDCQLGEAQTFEAFDTVKLPGRNSGLYIPSGFKANQFRPEQPGVNYNGFKTDVLVGVGAAYGAPKNIILNDSSSYNYSSARLDAQIFERWAGIIQMLCRPVLDSHLRTVLAANIEVPEVQKLMSLYDIDDIPCEWYFAAPTHIDRQKEAAADATIFANHGMTLRDYFAKRGKDWRDEIEQMKIEHEALIEAGVINENP